MTSGGYIFWLKRHDPQLLTNSVMPLDEDSHDSGKVASGALQQYKTASELLRDIEQDTLICVYGVGTQSHNIKTEYDAGYFHRMILLPNEFKTLTVRLRTKSIILICSAF